jgi:integrase
VKDINPRDNNGAIQIRFSYLGNRYNFNPVLKGRYKNTVDLRTAKSICTKINNDILSGHFDSTLARYKPQVVEEPKKPVNLNRLDYLALWDKWVKSLELSPETEADHYAFIRKMIVKATPVLNDTEWLTKAKLSAATFSKRRRYLKRCFSWAMDESLVKTNPWIAVKIRKIPKEKIKPFSQDELKQIIVGLSSRPHYCHFAKFLMLTGVRMSEAVGLTWDKIDFSRGEILISESRPIDRADSGYKRKVKSTKTGSIRTLNLTDSLKELLSAIPRSERDSLVFHSCRGFQISDNNFRVAWRKTLADMGIEYRRPHILRHTLISIALDCGMPILSVAYLAGHSSCQTIINTYGHIINRPNLPDLNL